MSSYVASELTPSGSIPATFRSAALSQSVQPCPVASVLGGGTLGEAYSETITAVGGTAPYTFSLASGSLPTGLSLSNSGGVCLITGTPTATGLFTFAVEAIDANGNPGTFGFNITIGAPSGSGSYGWSY